MRKIVLDTNVLISGVIASGHSAWILDAVRKEDFKLVTSAHRWKNSAMSFPVAVLPANIPAPLK